MSKQPSKTRARAGASPSGELDGTTDGGAEPFETQAAPEAPKASETSAETGDKVGAAVAPVSALVGWARIDGDNVLRGWATDRLDRDMRATVDISIDDEPVVSLAADLLDPKLIELGEGDGRYAFAMVIPAEYRDGEMHRFDVRVRGTGFAVRSKVPTFAIAPDQTLPSLEVDMVGLDGIRGVLLGGQYSKSADLYLWSEGERLTLPVPAVWSGGHEVREFFIPFTAEILTALVENDLLLAASGMVEAGLGGFPLQRLETVLSADCGDDGVLIIAVDSPFASEIEEFQVDLLDASGAVVLCRNVPLFDGVLQLDLPPEMLGAALTVRATLADRPFPPALAPVGHRIGRLTVNGSFHSWTGPGATGWEPPPGGLQPIRGYYAFPDRIAHERGVSGDYVHFEGEGPATETVLLRQALERTPPAGEPFSASCLFRAANAMQLRLRIVDEEGAELASLTAEARRAWTWVFANEQIQLSSRGAGPAYLEILAAGDVALDIAGAQLGGDTFTDEPSAEESVTSGENLVENADLALWPKGVLVNLVGRGEIAAGWFAFNRRSSSPLQARAIFADESDQVGLAFAADKVPEYCRLEVRLHGPSMSQLAEGSLRFEIGAPAVARRLFSASSVALPEFLLVDRIMLLRRSAVSSPTGFNLVDETVAVVSRKLVVSRRYQAFDLPFTISRGSELPEFEWEETEATDDNAEYFMVFEFRQPFAIAVRGMSVTVNDRLRDRDETAPYLALEDRNISVQAEHVRGLASWVGSTVIDPLDRRRDATVSTPEVQRWRWSAAAAGSVEVVVCVYNAVEETLNCLESLIGTTTVPHTVRIIDDGSEPTVNRRLADFVRDKPWMMLSPNDGNKGYTYSADRGLRESEADWVVLLNSDTIVTPGWLEGLLECAASDPLIAFVGPLSNAATFQSLPDLYDSRNQWKTNDLPAGWTPARMAELVADLSDKAFPDAPLLNGFCTLMRREVFVEVGGLNHSAFPTGYGEENDLCLRVKKAGYRLALADHVYVYHSKSASFGSARRTELAKAGGKALRELHPDVDLTALTAGFREIPALVYLRAAVRSAYETTT